MMIFSCGKEDSGNKTVIDPVAKKETWATILKMLSIPGRLSCI